jgi:hypothetical protein
MAIVEILTTQLKLPLNKEKLERMSKIVNRIIIIIIIMETGTYMHSEVLRSTPKLGGSWDQRYAQVR